ncbi:MAG: MerR family transcriptional regulator [Candidatus Andeanibacterium colombiense]|uniref:MerR family transcriptional regulator n=1 Tax=Candidatus Andeanibacterium colombiense TaxID=3121345 RepID=A0AAJ5X7R9_9SPHN|nr:MAG: MerR family transcriptional regulator [Sphingomonadaceae bacterium]
MVAADPRFSDGKDPDALRTIGEVAQALGIKQHVLRYWEQQFPMLKPLKRSGGRRYYRPEDVRMVDTIDRLVNREGYTLKGARMALQGEGKPEAPAKAPSPSAPAGQDVVLQLRAIRSRLAAALEG